MKSTMSHSFSRVPTVTIPRSTFDRSHGHKTTFDGGLLIPFFLDEALPGDTLNLRTAAFARMSTPEYPVMDNAFIDTFFFSIPIRLVWDNWRKFCGEQIDPGDSIDYTIPATTSAGSTSEGSLHDYFGIPKVANVSTNILPFRAYWLVWNEWFRDQNLQDSAELITTDAGTVLGSVPTESGASQWYWPAQRGKRHDYFTSCLPWPQKGDDVSLPLGTSAPVATDANSSDNLGVISTDQSDLLKNMLANSTNVQLGTTTVTSTDGLYADLTNATAATINDLRESFQIQKLLEKDARSGTRYSELIASHFQVTFVDATYRPEYLGGGSSPLNINAVASTYDDGTNNTQGELGAVGTFGFTGHGFVKSFTEHCYVLGICSVRTDLNYQQGLNRLWSRSTRYDFYWPSLSQIGEQAVLNKEIYAQGNANDDLVFGYQERYGEYRYMPSKITGQFKSTVTTPLDAWHFAEEFGSLPSLNYSFILDPAATVIDRTIATPSEPQFIADFWFDYKCARPMPLFGTPGMIDHF